jgi:AcrR family transcriptional regulator
MQAETPQPPAGQPEDTNVKYLARLLPMIKQRGLSHARIEDLVRAMDISKATFYKHFASKEAVVEGMVEMVVGYLRQASALIDDETISHMQRFQQAFQHSLLIASYLSEEFLLDLRQAYSALWERVKQAQQQRLRSLQRLYESGNAAGVFQPLNAALVALQDDIVLRAIVDPLFLMEHDLTVGAALRDCYEAHKYQWLTPAAREAIDDAPVSAYIEMMVRKISLSLRVDRAV